MVDRVARVVTEVCAPWVVNVAVAVLVGWSVSATWWGLFAAAIAGGIPIVGIVAMKSRGQVGDHHVTDRGQRTAVVAMIIVVMVAGFVAEALLGAPREIVFTSTTGLIVISAVAAVTVAGKFKISVHTAVWAGSAVLLGVCVSWWWLAAAALTPVVGWSRVALGDHTVKQVAWGAVLGAVATAGVAALF